MQYWDATKLKYAGTCPRKFQYRVLEGWSTKAASVDLQFGLHFATGMNTFYKHLDSDRETAIIAAVKQVMLDSWADKELLDSVTDKSRVNLIRSLVWYLDHYEKDLDILQIDGSPAVEVSFQVEVSPDITFCGHLDRVVKGSDGETYILDQKTTKSNLAPWYFRTFDLDDQMSMYSLVARQILKSPIQGVWIDAVRVAVGFTEFDRGFTPRSIESLQEWLTDAFELINRFQTYETQGYYPKNTNSCGFFSGCEFRNVCSSSGVMREKLLKTDFIKTQPWQPEIPR